jgi:hypothetical protein
MFELLQGAHYPSLNIVWIFKDGYGWGNRKDHSKEQPQRSAV